MAKTPEQWLEEAAPEKKGGTLKLFLGYAPGVGKTYSMLSEAIRRKSRGEDVVIGIIETHGRKGIQELAAQLEPVPDWVPLSATETVMVDLTPEALVNRMRRGDVYGKEKVEQSLKNFFRRGNLIALRELALRQVAEQVDRSLETYMDAKQIRENWGVRERLAVCVSGGPTGQYLIARAARMARRLDAELYVVHVMREFATREEDPKILEANLRFAENLGAVVVRLKGRSVADTIADFVRSKHITQVVFGRALVRDWKKFLYLSIVHRFLRESPAVDVHIVTQEPEVD